MNAAIIGVSITLGWCLGSICGLVYAFYVHKQANREYDELFETSLHEIAELHETIAAMDTKIGRDGQ